MSVGGSTIERVPDGQRFLNRAKIPDLFPCPGGPAVITSGRCGETKLACETAAETFGFFESGQVWNSFEVCDKIPSGIRGSCIEWTEEHGELTCVGNLKGGFCYLSEIPEGTQLGCCLGATTDTLLCAGKYCQGAPSCRGANQVVKNYCSFFIFL